MSKIPEFDFESVLDRKGSASLKWERYAGKDVLPLWVADMDFKSPPSVIAALQARAAHGVFGYTLPPDDLIDAVRSRLQADYRWAVAPEWLVWLPGLVCGLNVTCRAIGEDGDDVLTSVPVYPPFLTAPVLSRRKLVTVGLDSDGSTWFYNLEQLAQAVTPRTRLFLLCNPHNPVGRVFSRTELEQVAEFGARHDLVLCSDEIHCDLVLDPDKRHLPIAALDPAVADRTITLMAPSKTYNLPGLNCAYAIIPNARRRRRFKQAMAGIVPNVNLMGYCAALAALRDDGRWLAALRRYLRANRDMVYEVIEDLPGFGMGRVEATYLAWIDTRASGIKDAVAFFETAGVGLSDGELFGARGFVRLNFGSPRAVIATALQRMQAAVAAR